MGLHRPKPNRNPISAPVIPKKNGVNEHRLSGCSQSGFAAFHMKPVPAPAPAPTAVQNSAPFPFLPLVDCCAASALDCASLVAPSLTMTVSLDAARFASGRASHVLADCSSCDRGCPLRTNGRGAAGDSSPAALAGSGALMSDIVTTSMTAVRQRPDAMLNRWPMSSLANASTAQHLASTNTRSRMRGGRPRCFVISCPQEPSGRERSHQRRCHHLAELARCASSLLGRGAGSRPARRANPEEVTARGSRKRTLGC